MIKKEYFRLLKSKWTFIWWGVLSLLYFIFCLFQKIEINNLQQLLERQAKDADLSKVKILLDGTNGFTYLFNFYFSSDFYIVFSIICLLFIGIIFGMNDYCVREGMGNFILSRINYNKYISKVITARALYIVTFISIYEFITYFFTLIFNPIKRCTAFNFSLNLSTKSFSICLILLILNLIVLSSYLIIVTFFSFVLNIKASNKYIMMFIPFLIYIIPFISCSVVYSISPSVAKLIELFISDRYISIIDSTYKIGMFQPAYISSPLIFLFLGLTLLGWILRKKMNFLNFRS